MKELYKATSLLSIQRAVGIIFGVIRIKVSAIFLEPAGLGIIGQVTDLRVFFERFVNIGVGAGVIKYVAEYKSAQDKQALQGLYQTLISGFAITGGLVVLICLIFAPSIAGIVLGDPNLWFLITLTGITVALTEQVQIVYRFLQGMLKFRQIVILGLISTFIGFLISIPLIILLGVTGAVLSVTLLALISLVIVQIYFQTRVLKNQGIRFNLVIPKKEIVLKLLRFGGVSSIQVLSDTLTLLIIRSMIINEIGVDGNGLYQVAIATSVRYLGLIFVSIWQYGIPKLSTILDDRPAQFKVQNDALRLLFLAVTPLMVLILVFRTVWIPLLYSTAFLGAYTLITWQLLGDVFKSISTPANLILLPKERFTFIIILTLMYSALQLISFVFFLPSVGLLAAPISYAIGRGFIVPLTHFYHYKYEHFTYSKRNWLLVVKSSLVIVLTMVLTYSLDANFLLGYILPLVFLGLWAFTALNREETQKVIKVFQKKLSKLR